MSLRPRNTATAEQLAAVLKGCLSCLAPEKYLQVDLDLVVEEYVDTMLLVLKVTRKPIASVVASAASLAFGLSPQEATAFGQRLTAAFAYCQQKKKSCTSGKKLSPAVYRAVRALETARPSRTPPKTLANIHCEDLPNPSGSHTSSTLTTRAELLQMYKVEPHRSSPQLPTWADTDEVLILSSQEDTQAVTSGSASSTAQAGETYVQYLDTACKSLARAITEKSKQELEDIVDASFLRLAAGQSEAVVEQWAKDPL